MNQAWPPPALPPAPPPALPPTPPPASSRHTPAHPPASLKQMPAPAPARQTPPVVGELLARYGAATRAAVETRLGHHRATPYLHDLVTDYPRRGGKMMRPALCIAAARAAGAPVAAARDAAPDAAIEAATAIELFHNALLIHDDIQDASEVRRGTATLHALHGIPLAINAGDALMLMALQPLFDVAQQRPPATARAIFAATQTMARETVEGQALELGWRDHNRSDVTEADYLAMVLKKTSWMSFIWPLQVGLALAPHGRRVDPQAVVRFGFFLGAAFQIQDDLLNLVADAAYGKERGGDLYEAKRTLMLIHVLAAARGRDRTRLDAFLARPRAARTPAMVAGILAMMTRHGSIAHARRLAGAMAGAAAHEFELAFGNLAPSPDKDFIQGLIPWVFERT